MTMTLPPLMGEVSIPLPLVPDPDRGSYGTFHVGRTAYALTGWSLPGRSAPEKATPLFLLTGVRGAEYGLMPHATQTHPGVTTLALVNVGRRGGWSTPRWAQGLLFVLTDDGRFGYVR